MSEAPKTIWACKEFGSFDWDAGTFCTVDDGGEEYTLTASVSAQLKAADELAEVLEGVTGKQWASIATMEDACAVDAALTSYRKAKETT